MSNFRSPDVLERRNNAAAVKKAMLEKFKAAALDPTLEEKRLNRIEINKAREIRAAEREATRRVHEAEIAAQTAREAELAVIAQKEKDAAEALIVAEAAEREAAIEAEKKAERDARYAARKAAKKVRRRGY